VVHQTNLKSFFENERLCLPFLSFLILAKYLYNLQLTYFTYFLYFPEKEVIFPNNSNRNSSPRAIAVDNNTVILQSTLKSSHSNATIPQQPTVIVQAPPATSTVTVPDFVNTVNQYSNSVISRVYGGESNTFFTTTPNTSEIIGTTPAQKRNFDEMTSELEVTHINNNDISSSKRRLQMSPSPVRENNGIHS